MSKIEEVRSIGSKVAELHRQESGLALVEALIALGLLGIVATVFLNSMAISARADLSVTRRSTAEALAASQADYIKQQTYINFAQVGHGDYALVTAPTLYTISVVTVPIDPATGQPLGSGQDNGVQQIAVTVSHQGKTIITLQDYRVNR